MSQHAREYVVLPSWKFTHLIMVHAEFGFGLLEALFDSPAQATEPHKGFQSGARRGVADEIAVLRILSKGSDGSAARPFFVEDHPLKV
jgi:hypothetical protein